MPSSITSLLNWSDTGQVLGWYSRSSVQTHEKVSVHIISAHYFITNFIIIIINI